MKVPKFYRLNYKNQKLLYVSKNLYVLVNKYKDIYKCKSKNCKSEIRMINKKCVYATILHNHKNNAQKKFFELKSWQKIENCIQKYEEKLLNKCIKPREIFEEVKSNYKHFNLNYKKHYQTIQNKMNKLKHMLTHENKRLFLNTFGKKLLAIDKKFEHFLKEWHEKNENELNTIDFENKTNCKICFENEANIRLDPCGHILCEICLNKIYELRMIKLRERYNSERLIKNKLKIDCYKCRALILNKHKIFY